MPLDESTRRFAFLLQRDVRRLAERLSERTDRGEEMRADSSSRVVTWVNRTGEMTARQFAEVLATYDTRDRILRWGWAGRASSASPSHGDTIVREAHDLAQDIEDEIVGALPGSVVSIHIEPLEDPRAWDDIPHGAEHPLHPSRGPFGQG